MYIPIKDTFVDLIVEKESNAIPWSPKLINNFENSKEPNQSKKKSVKKTFRLKEIKKMRRQRFDARGKVLTLRKDDDPYREKNDQG